MKNWNNQHRRSFDRIVHRKYSTKYYYMKIVLCHATVLELFLQLNDWTEYIQLIFSTFVLTLCTYLQHRHLHLFIHLSWTIWPWKWKPYNSSKCQELFVQRRSITFSEDLNLLYTFSYISEIYSCTCHLCCVTCSLKFLRGVGASPETPFTVKSWSWILVHEMNFRTLNNTGWQSGICSVTSS